jgi:hypothetical protein
MQRCCPIQRPQTAVLHKTAEMMSSTKGHKTYSISLRYAQPRRLRLRHERPHRMRPTRHASPTSSASTTVVGGPTPRSSPRSVGLCLGQLCDESSVHHPFAIHRDPGHIHPMVTRRSVGVLRPVDRLVVTTDATPAPSPVPSSVHAALANLHWRRAMEEYAALLANHIWNLVPRPPDTNVVTGKWIFHHKLTPDGSLDRYKACWILRGFTQRPKVD